MSFSIPATAADKRLVVSVVSHGHGDSVQRLLDQIARFSARSVSRVVLTLNRPQDAPAAPAHGWPFPLNLRENLAPLGFSANHNRALLSATEPYVCILNPDVALDGSDPFAALIEAAAGPGVGCAYPHQSGASGQPQDFERALPTPAALVRRRLFGRGETATDWVNAACLVLPRPVWRQLGGFDERYFMYCEDVDLCLRLRLHRLRLVRADAHIVHEAQRASRREARALGWHLASLLRLWCSPAYRDTRRVQAHLRPRA